MLPKGTLIYLDTIEYIYYILKIGFYLTKFNEVYLYNVSLCKI